MAYTLNLVSYDDSFAYTIKLMEVFEEWQHTALFSSEKNVILELLALNSKATIFV